jgi:hypothetical protein
MSRHGCVSKDGIRVKLAGSVSGRRSQRWATHYNADVARRARRCGKTARRQRVIVLDECESFPLLSSRGGLKHNNDSPYAGLFLPDPVVQTSAKKDADLDSFLKDWDFTMVTAQHTAPPPPLTRQQSRLCPYSENAALPTQEYAHGPFVGHADAPNELPQDSSTGENFWTYPEFETPWDAKGRLEPDGLRLAPCLEGIFYNRSCDAVPLDLPEIYEATPSSINYRLRTEGKHEDYLSLPQVTEVQRKFWHVLPAVDDTKTRRTLSENHSSITSASTCNANFSHMTDAQPHLRRSSNKRDARYLEHSSYCEQDEGSGEESQGETRSSKVAPLDDVFRVDRDRVGSKRATRFVQTDTSKPVGFRRAEENGSLCPAALRW